MTMILSALRRVLRRWAMVMTVQARHQPLQGLDHQVFGLGVQRRGRLVEDQNRVVADERAGDPDALALTARERRTSLADQSCRIPGACG